MVDQSSDVISCPHQTQEACLEHQTGPVASGSAMLQPHLHRVNRTGEGRGGEERRKGEERGGEERRGEERRGEEKRGEEGRRGEERRGEEERGGEERRGEERRKGEERGGEERRKGEERGGEERRGGKGRRGEEKKGEKYKQLKQSSTIQKQFSPFVTSSNCLHEVSLWLKASPGKPNNNGYNQHHWYCAKCRAIFKIIQLESADIRR